MIVLGFDTATRSTAVALRLADGRTLQARDDPAPEERPGHATRLLGMADELLAGAGIGWSALQRIAVGRGPGTFTGLRVGVATARGIAQSLGIELVGVSSLRALAEGVRRSDGGEEVSPAGDREGILAVLDARRGEAFAAAYLPNERGSLEELLSPRALSPEELGGIRAQVEARLADELGERWLAVGDGAVRFRGELEAAGVAVPPDASPAHLLSAEAICELGARTPTPPPDGAILPEYGRRPDAEIALERRRTSGSTGAKGEEALAAEAAAAAAVAGRAGGKVDGP
ncbi:MAG TPA: tRNA (adenosine(37)-N6)-threonylcarbamoyltransferase complex dimerization subunit type 1 TsaB [Solirubrobacteraceae bacterium]|jgi:tRNA threonylcarbamoyladenosine biosynthesis protein TsaB